MSVSIDVVDRHNAVVEKVDIEERVFNVKVKPYLLHGAVVAYLANKRRGNASTKTRAAVRGGGAKPWRQKGTGRARAGSTRTPLKRGGGVVFGPHPRLYTTKISKKQRREGLKSALTIKVQEGNVLVLDKIEFEQAKTKQLVSFMTDIGLSGKVLFVLSGENKNLELASRNVQGVEVVYANSLNVYVALQHDKIVCTKETLDSLVKHLVDE